MVELSGITIAQMRQIIDVLAPKVYPNRMTKQEDIEDEKRQGIQLQIMW